MHDATRRRTLQRLQGVALAGAAGAAGGLLPWRSAWAAAPAPAPAESPHAAPAADGAAPLLPWRPARPPRLDATDLAGQRRSLADFAGRPLLVNVWATWCGPCRVEMPSLNALAERLQAQGLHFVALNHGEMPERVRRFLAEVPLHATVLLDRSQTLLKAWGGGALPATFLFDAAGTPRLWARGERDWAAPAVVRSVEAVVLGKTVGG